MVESENPPAESLRVSEVLPARDNVQTQLVGREDVFKPQRQTEQKDLTLADIESLKPSYWLHGEIVKNKGGIPNEILSNGFSSIADSAEMSGTDAALEKIRHAVGNFHAAAAKTSGKGAALGVALMLFQMANEKYQQQFNNAIVGATIFSPSHVKIWARFRPLGRFSLEGGWTDLLCVNAGQAYFPEKKECFGIWECQSLVDYTKVRTPEEARIKQKKSALSLFNKRSPEVSGSRYIGEATFALPDPLEYGPLVLAVHLRSVENYSQYDESYYVSLMPGIVLDGQVYLFHFKR